MSTISTKSRPNQPKSVRQKPSDKNTDGVAGAELGQEISERTWLFSAGAILVVGAFAGGGWAYAQRSAGGVRALSGADIAEIQQLHARYNQGWDFRDVDLYLSAYTDAPNDFAVLDLVAERTVDAVIQDDVKIHVFPRRAATRQWPR